MKVDLLSLQSYNYELPPDRIAQFPVTPRDSSRLLVISRDNKTFEDSNFRNLPTFLRKGDLLVLNDTRVIPARLLFDRGEILFVREVEKSCWDCMVFPGSHFKPGTFLTIGDLKAEVLSQSTIGRLIRFQADVPSFLAHFGQVPLPPYIERDPNEADRQRYQTVYARKPGSIAAPTAERCARSSSISMAALPVGC